MVLHGLGLGRLVVVVVVEVSWKLRLVLGTNFVTDCTLIP